MKIYIRFQDRVDFKVSQALAIYFTVKTLFVALDIYVLEL